MGLGNENIIDIVELLKKAIERFNIDTPMVKFERNIDSMSSGLNSLRQQTDDLRDSQDELTENLRTYGKKDLGQLRNSVSDAAIRTKQMGKSIEEAEKSLDALGDAQDAETEQKRKEIRQRLTSMRQEYDEATNRQRNLETVSERHIKSIEKLSQTGTQFKQLVTNILNSTLSLAQNLLSSNNAIQFGTAGVVTAAGALGDTLRTVGSAAQAAGYALLAAPNPYVKAAGGLSIVAGKVSEMFAELSDVAKKGAEILGAELEKTAVAYQGLATVGATFARGMDEMRDTANSAVMGLSQFSKIITSNADAFSKSGLGVAAATKRFAELSRSMSETGVRGQILNLGYSIEEFGGLTADVMARLGAAGDRRINSDSAVSALTLEYAKNLRMISNITGEDARKKMDEARKASLKAGIYERVLAMGGEKGLEKFQQMMTVIPASMQQGVMEFIASGGTAVRDASLNIALQQIPSLRGLLTGMIDSISDPSKDATQATDDLLSGFKNAKGEVASLGIASATAAIGIGSIFGATGPAAEYATFIGQFREFVTKIPDDIKVYRQNLEQTAINPGPLSESVKTLTESFTRGQAVLEKIISEGGLLNQFATAAGNMVTTLDSMTKAMKEWATKNGAGGTTGSTTGSTTGAENRANVAAHGISFVGTPAKALGGITSGVSIAGERGPEAVVPLPDGRTIPVRIESTEAAFSGVTTSGSNASDLKSSIAGLVELTKKQISIMADQIEISRDSLTTLRTSYDTQERLLSNSY